MWLNVIQAKLNLKQFWSAVLHVAGLQGVQFFVLSLPALPPLSVSCYGKYAVSIVVPLFSV